MANRKYTREFEISTVSLVNAQGYTIPEAAKRMEALKVKIKKVHEENRCVYGSRRVCAAIEAEGETVCATAACSTPRASGQGNRSLNTLKYFTIAKGYTVC